MGELYGAGTESTFKPDRRPATRLASGWDAIYTPLSDLWCNRPSARRRRRAAWSAALARHRLTEDDVARVARFNTDQSRRLVHDEDYAARMVALRARYDQAAAEVPPWL